MNGEDQVNFQKELMQFIVNDVFNTITKEDILRQTKEGWTHKGIILTEGQVNLLKRDAEMFRKSNLYKVLIDELNWQARLHLEGSKTESDMISAKMLSYFVDIVADRVKKIAEL